MSRRGSIKRAPLNWAPPVPCACNRCHATVKRGHLYCRDHWFALPHGLRTALLRTHRAGHWASYQDYFRQAQDHLDAGRGQIAGRKGFVFVDEYFEAGRMIGRAL